MALAVGSPLGRDVICSHFSFLIGEGDMGDVYPARDTKLNPDVPVNAREATG